MLTLLSAVLVAASPPSLSLPAQKVTLPNGLVVIAAPDRSVPGVVVDVWYRVGSRDEQPGRTGFAHLFEHLMFMGARYAPYPRFDSIMEAAGGNNNASTSQDTTNYFEIGPSTLLETFLWLEGDRLATLDREMTDEKLKSQRLIVQNERRQSYENRPYGLADLAVDEQLYPAGHPYSWSPIGSHRDLEAASTQDVLSFFRTWYVPNNAVLVVVGNAEPERVFALATKYLGFIPSRPLPARTRPAPYVMTEEKRVSLTDKVEADKLIVAWPSAPAYTEGDAEADLVATILGDGEASRLYQRLVKKDQLASAVSAQQSSMEYGSVFSIEAVAVPGVSAQRLKAALDDELARFTTAGPTPAEVDSARSRLVTDMARRVEGLISRAVLLAGYEVAYGDPTAVQKDLERYTRVTPASLAAAARALLVPGRLVVDVTPAAAGGVR